MWSLTRSPLRHIADFWILLSLFSILFCREDEKNRREWEAEMKSNIATGSPPPLQVRLSIAGKGGSASKGSRGEASWVREASWTPLGQQPLWSSALREKSIQGKGDWCWITQPSPEPAGQMTSHTHGHTGWHTYKYILTYSYAIFCTITNTHTYTLMTTTHLHMHGFVGLVFLEALLFWRNLLQSKQASIIFSCRRQRSLLCVFPHFCTQVLYLRLSMSPSTPV